MSTAISKRLAVLETKCTPSRNEIPPEFYALYARASRHYHGEPLEDGDLPITPEMQEIIDIHGELDAMC